MTFPPRSSLSISSAMRSSLSAMPRSSFDCSRSFFPRSSLLGRETPRIGSPLLLERGTLINFPDSFCSPFTSFPFLLQILIAFLLFHGATSRGEFGRRGDGFSFSPSFFSMIGSLWKVGKAVPRQAVPRRRIRIRSAGTQLPGIPRRRHLPPGRGDDRACPEHPGGDRHPSDPPHPCPLRSYQGDPVPAGQPGHPEHGEHHHGNEREGGHRRPAEKHFQRQDLAGYHRNPVIRTTRSIIPALEPRAPGGPERVQSVPAKAHRARLRIRHREGGRKGVRLYGGYGFP